MSRTRTYRIRMREEKIRRRKEMICTLPSFKNAKIMDAVYSGHGGLLDKGHYGAFGGNQKTKTRKAYASYRHKGGYGKAKVYSRHDKVQITYMKNAYEEYSFQGN